LRTSKRTSPAPFGSRGRGRRQRGGGRRRGDLESMKMEMPVEAEIRRGQGDLCAEGNRVRGDTRCPRMSRGQLLIDEPAPHVVRLVISNPGKRGAPGRAILDRSPTCPKLERVRDHHGRGADVLGGYDIAIFPQRPRDEAENSSRTPSRRQSTRSTPTYPTVARFKSRHRRWTGAGGLLRSADRASR